MELVGNFRQETSATKRGRTSDLDKEQRLNGKLHIIVPHPEGKHKDCLVCSKRNVPGRRRETINICEKLLQKISPVSAVNICIDSFKITGHISIHFQNTLLLHKIFF